MSGTAGLTVTGRLASGLAAMRLSDPMVAAARGRAADAANLRVGVSEALAAAAELRRPGELYSSLGRSESESADPDASPGR